MSWRPDDWKNPYPRYPYSQSFDKVNVFEAGADAMLEALKENGVYKEDWFLSGAGWSIFIPDEEENA